MKRTFKRDFLIVILLIISFLGCHSKSDNTTQNLDSSDAVQSTYLRQSIDTVIIQQGEILFKSNCSSCHAIFMTDNILRGVVQRVGDKYLKLYLTKQDSLIKARDKYALRLKEAFGNQCNNHNFYFSDEQLNAIISYLKKYSN